MFGINFGTILNDEKLIEILDTIELISAAFDFIIKKGLSIVQFEQLF